jgi:hypothetical protein
MIVLYTEASSMFSIVSLYSALRLALKGEEAMDHLVC